MYDAIIVGARCGGAPLAMQLARAGHRVLLLDRMAFGSDIMSTHYVKRTGAAHLANWGLLERLEALGTPAIRNLNFHIDGLHLAGQAPPVGSVDADYTPRRFYLDRLLVDAALEAGVEGREHFTVKELIFDGDRVVGIRGAERGGQDVVERGKVVIGADGARSKVAEAVGAEMVVDAGIHTCGHYAYFSGMRERDDTASLHIRTDERRFYITFPTNDDLDMVFLFWPTAAAKRVRSDLEGAYQESLRLVPELEARVQGGKRETRISGTHLLYNFFRRAHGPGWGLVGDAALHRDPITAQGITNAFTHAQILAEELTQAFAGERSIDAALTRYDERQFAALKPMFDYTVHLAMLQPLPEEVQAMVPLLLENPEAVSAFIGAFLGSVPLDAVFTPTLMERFAADVARGQEEVRRVA